MASVVIKRCPTCSGIRSHAQEMSDALRSELDVSARIEDGATGELSVFVDGVPVIQRTGDTLPSADEVEAAVRNAAPVGA